MRPPRNTEEGNASEAQFVWSIFLFVGAVLIFAAVYGFYLFFCAKEECLIFEWQRLLRTNSFEECAARGYPVEDTSPRECRAGRRVFLENSP